ncbi:hypothetical protein IAR55_000675 [Kwoniella newhampshirensis]|uniref:Zn(2)-C6 fungal-type domain-containing protein n=1 Tax=Kwoniella newhampshirensis TaxID=1651941 RepID=A0AAW0Z886_9TREE
MSVKATGSASRQLSQVEKGPAGGREVSPDGKSNVGGRSAKRARAILVCNRCKSLKTKCDLKTPCGSCVKARTEDRCVYEPWKSAGTAPTSHKAPPTPSSSSSPSTQQTLSHQAPPTSLVDNRLSDIEIRLNKLERASPANTRNDQLAHVDDHEVSVEAEWSSLLSELPDRQIADELLDRYYHADTLYRYTHEPSYTARYINTYTSLSNGTLTPDQAPYLASMTMALVIGNEMIVESKEYSTYSAKQMQRSLPSLHQRLLTISERVAFGSRGSSCTDTTKADGIYYHVHALLLGLERYVVGATSSIVRVWCELGKVVNMAVLFKLNVDPLEVNPELSVWQCEMRRRLWWIISIGEKISTWALNLPSNLPKANVRQPAIVPDAFIREDITQEQLDFASAMYQPTAPGAMPAEWLFPNMKYEFFKVLTAVETRARQSRGGGGPSPQDAIELDRAVEDFTKNLPWYYQYEAVVAASRRESHLAGNHQPPWVIIQACVHHLVTNAKILSIYQSHIAVWPKEDTGVNLPLERSLVASHRLLFAAETLAWLTNMRWPEKRSLLSWNFGSKVFLAGATLALAGRSEPNHRQYDEWMDDVTTAIGLLNMIASQRATTGVLCQTDQKAVETLKKLYDQAQTVSAGFKSNTSLSRVSAANIQGRVGVTVGVGGGEHPTGTTVGSKQDRVFDPYTASEVNPLPSPANTPSGIRATSAHQPPSLFATTQLALPPHMTWGSAMSDPVNLNLIGGYYTGASSINPDHNTLFAGSTQGEGSAGAGGASGGAGTAGGLDAEHFSLEDLETLLRGVYGATEGSTGF